MITISLDEGYIFDILSVYEIKLTKNPNHTILLENIKRLQEEIISQIGDEKFKEIKKSNEYKELLEANLVTFELVDLAKESEGLAKQVDASNYERYLRKSNLQKKFFNNSMIEVKIGYNKPHN